MSTLTQLLTKAPQLAGRPASERKTSRISIKKIVEGLWCVTSFLLFLALGPFAAIATVMSVASLASGQAEKAEPESIH